MTTKILLLDLFWINEDKTHKTLKSIVEQQDCELVELDPVPPGGEWSKEEVQVWLDDVVSKISEAHAFVWLGSDLLFLYAGALADRFVDTIVEKIDNGVPILIQCSDVASPIQQSERSAPAVKRILSAVNVAPLDLKVVSHLHRAESQQHDYSCLINRDNGFLREPRIFREVLSVEAHSPRLLNYDGEMLPIIDVPAPDYLCVDSGDLFWRGELGIHRTIAAASYCHDSIQMVFSTDLFRDAMTSGMGLHFPRIENNRKLAENVVKLLMESAKNSKAYQLEAYQIFDSLERDMGKLVTEVVGEERILEALPESVHSSLTAYNPTPDLSQATFNDLIKILLHHWQLVGDYFVDISKTKLKSMLNRLNTGNRRYLAHPYKAERMGITFEASDVDELRETFTLISSARRIAR